MCFDFQKIFEFCESGNATPFIKLCSSFVLNTSKFLSHVKISLTNQSVQYTLTEEKTKLE